MVLHKHVVKVCVNYVEVSTKYYSHNTILMCDTITNIRNVCFDFINEFCCSYRRNYGRRCYYQGER